MESRIKWTRYNGQEILFQDFSNLKNEEVMETIKKATKYSSSNTSENIYMLCDFTNTKSTIKILKEIKRAAENGITQIIAAVGLTIKQRIIINTLKPNAYFAKNHLDGMEWLTLKTIK